MTLSNTFESVSNGVTRPKPFLRVRHEKLYSRSLRKRIRMIYGAPWSHFEYSPTFLDYFVRNTHDAWIYPFPMYIHNSENHEKQGLIHFFIHEKNSSIMKKTIRSYEDYMKMICFFTRRKYKKCLSCRAFWHQNVQNDGAQPYHTHVRSSFVTLPFHQ